MGSISALLWSRFSEFGPIIPPLHVEISRLPTLANPDLRKRPESSSMGAHHGQEATRCRHIYAQGWKYCHEIRKAEHKCAGVQRRARDLRRVPPSHCEAVLLKTEHPPRPHSVTGDVFHFNAVRSGAPIRESGALHRVGPLPRCYFFLLAASCLPPKMKK